jgi:hypothetical protein
MTGMNLSPTERVKRGFHRIGIAIATVLAAGTLTMGILISLHEVGAQQSRFSELRCAYNEARLGQDFKRNMLPPELTAVLTNNPARRILFEALVADEWAREIPIGKIGCGRLFSTATVREIMQSGAADFSYSGALIFPLGLTALIASLIAFASYFAVSTASWIARGFMRN